MGLIEDIICAFKSDPRTRAEKELDEEMKRLWRIELEKKLEADIKRHDKNWIKSKARSWKE